MKSLILVLATWCGSGLAPVAPGTFGTLAAIPLYLLLARLDLPLYLAFLVRERSGMHSEQANFMTAVPVSAK